MQICTNIYIALIRSAQHLIHIDLICQVVEAEESSSAMEEEASVVMRKNEHNEFLSNRGSEGTTTKPDSLDLEQEHEHTSGFWTHRSSVISVTDSAR